MIVRTFDTTQAMGSAAARHAAEAMQRAIASKGRARIVVATGTSQLQFLQELTQHPGVDWSRVELFHLDEYVGLPLEHPASFRKYILERVIRRTAIQDYLLLDGEGDVRETCRLAGEALNASPVDVAFVGIGENGHLAFNDPPADVATEEPYIIVDLDEACRRQQVGEGWFGSMAEVPRQAISMSIRQILKAREIICVVPDARKAEPVRAALEGPITPELPASILRDHPRVTMYLDARSASLLQPQTLQEFRGEGR
jgi:glucosamine-6-phosphate deaminase